MQGKSPAKLLCRHEQCQNWNGVPRTGLVMKRQTGQCGFIGKPKRCVLGEGEHPVLDPKNIIEQHPHYAVGCTALQLDLWTPTYLINIRASLRKSRCKGKFGCAEKNIKNIKMERQDYYSPEPLCHTECWCLLAFPPPVLQKTSQVLKTWSSKEDSAMESCMNLGHTVPELRAAGDRCARVATLPAQRDTPCWGTGTARTVKVTMQIPFLQRPCLMQPEPRALITFGTG